VAVAVAVDVAVAVAVGVNAAVAVAVAVGVTVDVTVAVGVAVGVKVGVAVGVAVGGTVGVGLAQPPPVTLISTELVVLEPLYPPTTTAVLPTCVPTGNASGWSRVGPLVQLLLAGSYTCREFVVSGVNTRLSHALNPLLPEVGAVLGPVKGLPPPMTHSLPPITADPGTFTPLGILAPVVQLSVAML
jgi:hypothetical protein